MTLYAARNLQSVLIKIFIVCRVLRLKRVSRSLRARSKSGGKIVKQEELNQRIERARWKISFSNGTTDRSTFSFLVFVFCLYKTGIFPS